MEAKVGVLGALPLSYTGECLFAVETAWQILVNLRIENTPYKFRSCDLQVMSLALYPLS